MTRSIQPPKYPAIAPKKTPNTNDIKTATNPIEIEILEPIRSLLNKSRPYLSVPKRNCFSIK